MLPNIVFHFEYVMSKFDFMYCLCYDYIDVMHVERNVAVGNPRMVFRLVKILRILV